MMTLHYHGTPITPADVMLTLAGKCFCVSFFRPDQEVVAHQIGQSVLLDNGAFSAWKLSEKRVAAGLPPIIFDADYWARYHVWSDGWLDHPTTWAVIPDVIGAGSQEQDALIREWPHGDRGAPVWHTGEPLDRLFRLCDEWPKVCVGSTDEHRQVLGDPWRQRMDDAFNGLALRHRRMPWLHMLRGMQLATETYPFASLDSTDVARNHNRPQNTARAMADRWDAAQCPAVWTPRAMPRDIFGEAA